MRWGRWIAVLFGFAMLVLTRAAAATDGAGQTQVNPGAHPAQHHILIFGDSLSAEYGLPRGSGWVSEIERRLTQNDQAYQIRNASISGDTTIGGLQRLPTVLREFPADIVVLQLGANDGLRGLPVTEMKENLRKMISLSRKQGAQVLLVGQQIPPNYGQRYAREFHDAYGELARETGVALVPFMLEGIALDPGMFLPDGLHPTVDAQKHIAATIWNHLFPLLN